MQAKEGSESKSLMKNLPTRSRKRKSPSDKIVHIRKYSEMFGSNQGKILSHILWSIQTHIAAKDEKFFHDGGYWMYDTYAALAKWAGLTIRQTSYAIAKLRDRGILKIGQFDFMFGERRNWYGVDFAVLREKEMTFHFTSKLTKAPPRTEAMRGYKKRSVIIPPPPNTTSCSNASLLLRINKYISNNLDLTADQPSPKEDFGNVLKFWGEHFGALKKQVKHSFIKSCRENETTAIEALKSLEILASCPYLKNKTTSPNRIFSIAKAQWDANKYRSEARDIAKQFKDYPNIIEEMLSAVSRDIGGKSQKETIMWLQQGQLPDTRHLRPGGGFSERSGGYTEYAYRI